MKSVHTRNMIKKKNIRHISKMKCAICGKNGPLEVDHIVPKVKGVLIIC